MEPAPAERMIDGIPASLAWNVPPADLVRAEERATELGLAEEAGFVYLLAKRVNEYDATAGFGVASAAFAMKYPEEPAPVVVFDGQLYSHLRFFARDGHAIAVSARARLARLLSNSDTSLAGRAEEPRAALDAFIAANPLWTQGGDTCTLVFWCFPPIMDALILRVQLSGLCFLHAPIVALHYLLNMTARHPETIDISRFMLMHVGDGGTARYVLTDSGGSAESVLLQLAQPRLGATEATLVSRPYNFGAVSDVGPELRRLLSVLGPGVVTSFLVEEALASPRTSYTGARTTPLVGLHALVLVGVRFDVASGKYFMICQNSWARLPFFEVDEDYWYDCKAQVSFVNTKQTALRPGYATNDLLVAESAVVGAGVAEL